MTFAICVMLCEWRFLSTEVLHTKRGGSVDNIERSKIAFGTFEVLLLPWDARLLRTGLRVSLAGVLSSSYQAFLRGSCELTFGSLANVVLVDPLLSLYIVGKLLVSGMRISLYLRFAFLPRVEDAVLTAVCDGVGAWLCHCVG